VNAKVAMIVVVAMLAASCGGHDPYERMRTTRLEYGPSFINFYHIPTGPHPKSKLLIVISGSGYVSVLGKLEEGEWSWRGEPGWFAGNKPFSKDYDLLVPERTNVELGQDHTGDRSVMDTYTVEIRCASMALAIDTFLGNSESVPYEDIYLFGASQGGSLVPRIFDEMTRKDRIDKVVIVSASPGLSMFDMFIGFRNSGAASSEDMHYYNELEDIYEKVQLNKDSIDDLWWDDPYKMWHSFFDYLPLDYLKEIDIPILLVHGKDDSSSLVESSRIAAEEFRALGKTNLTYLELAGGHFCWMDNLELLGAWMEE